MPKVTQGFGLLLIILGVAAYGLSGAQSVTALIPAFFGAPLLATGLLAARQDSRRALWMHIAAALMTVGLLGTVRGAISFVGMVAGNDVARPAAVIVQTIMAVICAVFVGLAVRSFVNARRAEAAQASGS
mgnify:FL=1